MEKTVLSQPEYRSKAARYAAAAEHCESEVREKLYQWGCPETWHEAIIDYLYENNYLNDERYCRAFTHDKVAYQSWGRMKIRAALCARKLPSHLINQALNEIDENEYHRALHKLIQKRSQDDEERLIRFLLQRGFTYDEIHEAGADIH